MGEGAPWGNDLGLRPKPRQGMYPLHPDANADREFVRICWGVPRILAAHGLLSLTGSRRKYLRRRRRFIYRDTVIYVG